METFFMSELWLTFPLPLVFFALPVDRCVCTRMSSKGIPKNTKNGPTSFALDEKL